MEVLFARPRADALGESLADILPPDFRRALRRRARRRLRAHGTHTLYKFRLALPTGETRTTNISIAPLLTRSYDVVGRIIQIDDITDRLGLKPSSRRAEKLSSIGLLAAGVAHEVNTPLAVISSYTQMLSKQLRDDPRLSPVLEKITQQTFRASEIVNGLLNFSRTSGAEFVRIDLNQLLRDSAILLDHQFKTARIRIETDLAPRPRARTGQPGQAAAGDPEPDAECQGCHAGCDQRPDYCAHLHAQQPRYRGNYGLRHRYRVREFAPDI